MSDTKPVPPLPDGVISEELMQKIAGGECTYADYRLILDEAQATYDQLVDFTSYVIERVANSL